jgi:hypothetical protein
MTIYTPVRIFVAGSLILAALTAALNPLLSDLYLTVFAALGWVGVWAGVLVCLLWTDGEPPPVAAQLPRHVRIIEADSHETVG